MECVSESAWLAWCTCVMAWLGRFSLVLALFRILLQVLGPDDDRHVGRDLMRFWLVEMISGGGGMLTSMSWRWNRPLMAGELHTIGGRRLADIWPVFFVFGSRGFDVFAPRLAAWVGIASIGAKVSSAWCYFHFLAPPVTCVKIYAFCTGT